MAASLITNFLPSSGYAAALPHAPPRERRYSTSSSSSEGETDPGSQSGESFASFMSARERGSYDEADESADTASVPPAYAVTAPIGPPSSEESAALPVATNPTLPLSAGSSVSTVEDVGVLRARARAKAAIEKEEGKFREKKRRLAEKVEKVRRKDGEGEKLRKAEEIGRAHV